MKATNYVMVGSVQFDKNALPKRKEAFEILRGAQPFVYLDDAEEQINKALDESKLYPVKDIEVKGESDAKAKK